MSLNDYRNEAGFLAGADAANNGGDTSEKIARLQEELDRLKEAENFPDRMPRRMNDMLFLLFEIASDHLFDLDSEWEKGKRRRGKEK